MKSFLVLIAMLLAGSALAQKPYSLNGVPLGGTEAEVKKRFPAAHCKPLEWKTDAADRRCDDAQIAVAGVEAKVTFYLKANAIQAFDLRFDTKDLDKIMGELKGNFGAPRSETRDIIARKGKEDREVFKALWESGRDRAVLTALKDTKRGQLEVSRGGFADEVYRVR